MKWLKNFFKHPAIDFDTTNEDNWDVDAAPKAKTNHAEQTLKLINRATAERFCTLWETLNKSAFNNEIDLPSGSTAMFYVATAKPYMSIKALPDGEGGHFTIEYSVENDVFFANAIHHRKPFGRLVENNPERFGLPRGTKSTSLECMEVLDKMLEDKLITYGLTPRAQFDWHNFDDGAYWKKGDVIIRGTRGSLDLYRRVATEFGYIIKDEWVPCVMQRNDRKKFWIAANALLEPYGQRDETWTQCECPATEWVDETLNTQAMQRKKRSDELVEFVKQVFEKHTVYNDAAHKYEIIPAAAIKNFNTLDSFCRTIGLSNRFKAYEVENYLRVLGKYQPE